MAKAPVRYQLKVILDHIKPQIWRRIVVPANLTLWQLHTVLQVVMGWQESHLHSFEINGTEYGDPQSLESSPTHKILDEQVFQIDRVIPKQVGLRFGYTYDFGDNWEHIILVEKILPPEDGATVPACLAGKRAGALEDAGGPYGYLHLLEVLADPQHPEYEESSEWAGEDFDAEELDLAAVNQDLQVLAANDYQLEAVFDQYYDNDEDLIFDDDDSEEFMTDEILEGLFPDDDLEEPALEDPEAAGQILSEWVASQPPEVHQLCEALAIRKDYVAMLTYLRDHKVKGTEASGNLPLKAVRAINAEFADPQPLEVDGHKVRGEEQVPDMMFLHMLAYIREQLDGGPGEYWTVTDVGLAFLGALPAAQVADLFVGWLFEMRWEMLGLMSSMQGNKPFKARPAIIRVLANQPAGEWIPANRVIQEITQAAGMKANDPQLPVLNEDFYQTAVFMDLILPMLTFGAIELNRVEKLDLVEIRFTPLGTSLMEQVRKILN